MNGQVRDCGHFRDFLILAKAFVIHEQERLVLDDGAAKRHAILPHAEGRHSGERIVEIAGIEDGIAEITIDRAVVIVGAGFGDDIDLPAGLRAVFGVIERGTHAVFRDCVGGNLQADFRFLRLLLNTGGIHAVKGEVVVVA